MYEVEDNSGNKWLFDDNNYDEKVRFVFKFGQCLAFAIQLSLYLKQDKVLIYYIRCYSGEESADSENSFIDNISHAFAIDNEETFWDIDGNYTLEETYKIYGDFCDYEILDIDSAKEKYKIVMSEQNYVFAEKVIKNLF